MILSSDQKEKERLRRQAVEETKGAQKLIQAQQEARSRQHRQILELELKRLENEIHHIEGERNTIVHEVDTLRHQEAEAKQTLERTVRERGRERTEKLDIVGTEKKLQEELAQATHKKDTLTLTLKKLEQEEVNLRRTTPKTTHDEQKNTAKKNEITRRIETLEDEIRTLKSAIAADEARLKEEKATFSREEAELKMVKQELTKMDAHAPVSRAPNAEEIIQKEKKIRQEEEQTKTLLGGLERSIRELMTKIQEVTSRGQKEKQDEQKENREEQTAQQVIHADQQKLLDRDRRLKQFDADLRVRKEKKEKIEAEIKMLK